MGFSRQEEWSGQLLPPPGDLPDAGSEPSPPVSPAWADESFSEPPGKPEVGVNSEETLLQTP